MSRYSGKYSRKKLPVLPLVFLVLGLILGAMALSRTGKLRQEEALLQELAQSVATEPTAAAVPESGTPTVPSRYAGLYEENPDFFGWLTVEGTRIDYPVMHSPGEPEKYLHGDFSGNYAFSGTPFLDGKNTAHSDQLLVYGHNMANGSMFHDLFRYGDRSFWEAHPTLRLDTLRDSREFEILAVLYDRVYNKEDEVFKFYQFREAETEEAFREAVAYYREHSLYDTGIVPEYGEQLLTLVTCAYHVEDGRFLVVARETK